MACEQVISGLRKDGYEGMALHVGFRKKQKERCAGCQTSVLAKDCRKARVGCAINMLQKPVFHWKILDALIELHRTI